MRRRTVLASVGIAAIGLPGCLDGDSASGTPSGVPTGTAADGRDTTSTPSAETTTEPPNRSTRQPSVTGARVTVDAIQPAVVVRVTPDSIGVENPPDRQYVYLWITVSDGAGPGPSPSWFGLRFDGQVHRPMAYDPFEFPLWRGREGNPYERDGGFLLFDLPASGDADDAEVTWPGGEWPLPTAARRCLATPAPSLSVSVPEELTVSATETRAIEVRVTNEGDRPGRFVGAINREGGGIASVPLERLSFRVPAGETVTERVFDRYPFEGTAGDGEKDATYRFDYLGGEAAPPIRVVDDG